MKHSMESRRWQKVGDGDHFSITKAVGGCVVRITKKTGKKLIFVKKMCKSGWASGIESVESTEGHIEVAPV